MRRPITTAVIRPLRDRADSGLSVPGTAESRVALVATLTLEAWTLAGHPIPSYSRTAMPVLVRPLRDAPSRE